MKTASLFLFFLLMISPFSSWSSQEEKTSGIPPVAHFVYGIWDSGPLPPTFQDTIRLWNEQGWEVKLWRKPEIEKLLSLPENQYYKKIYEKFPRNVMKADFIRYLIVFREGGFYFDLDCQPHNSLFNHLASSLPNSPDVYFIEAIFNADICQRIAERHYIHHGIPETCYIRIANFAFGANKNSPLLEKTLELAALRFEKNPIIKEDYDILHITGPGCITEVVNRSLDSIVLIDHHHFMYHISTWTWRGAGDSSR